MGECFERFKMGTLMGASVGTGIGLIFGTITAIGYFISLTQIEIQTDSSEPFERQP